MGSSRGGRAVSASLGLVACGIVGTIAAQHGLWGLLTGATLVAGWLAGRNWWMSVRSWSPSPYQPAAPVATAPEPVILRVLLDAAPTPLLGIEGAAVRALNRAARTLFATGDRVLPVPAGLADRAVTHLRHEGRGWRIDRVAVAGGGSVVALIDIEQEERAAEARATAELIQILGHELMNGLAPIVSLAESGAAAIARAEIDQALLREILGTLARRAEALQRFTGAYRALARLPEPTRRPVRLRELADDLARLFAGRWPRVTLTVAVDADAIWSLDRDQIGQALWALLQNAAEAVGADAAAQVGLRIVAGDSGLTIRVTDNGPGVPAADVTRIFRPFHSGKADGTGIGLSLARQIALAHGGTLMLVPGRSAIFEMTLPE